MKGDKREERKSETERQNELKKKCRKDIDASRLCVQDMLDIPGLMDIPDWD